MRIKICGITRVEDALVCEKYGADAIGFIFYEKSKRYIEPEEAGKISKQLSPFMSKVETVDFLKMISVPVIKGFRVNNDFDFDVLNSFSDYGILLDSYSSEEYGGTGKSFDWRKIPTYLRNKIILAGGISSENIVFIMKEINPAAIDVSSSLEVSPGIKDHNKILKFINKINDYRSKYADIA